MKEAAMVHLMMVVLLWVIVAAAAHFGAVQAHGVRLLKAAGTLQ
jgi:hypothetical protein